jgi:hypothetical protein
VPELVNRAFRLAERPEGLPSHERWELTTGPVQVAAD